MKPWIIFVCAVSSSLAGCTAEPAVAMPAFVDQHISRMKTEPVANPPASVWRYQYKGVVVYYIPPKCCDVPSDLYTEDGRLLCSPDGGLTGRGDGKCPDFFDTRTEGELVWADTR